MTPAELAAALRSIGWPAAHLAEELGCSRNLPAAWLSGRAVVPPKVATVLRALAEAHERHPMPQDWRTRSAA